MASYTDDQLRDLLELWDRNSQGLSEAQMFAVIEWDETPEPTRVKIQKMLEARQTGVHPQRLSAAEETYLQGRGLGPEAEGSEAPSKRSLKDRLRGKRPDG
jgi:hypothetical protein